MRELRRAIAVWLGACLVGLGALGLIEVFTTGPRDQVSTGFAFSIGLGAYVSGWLLLRQDRSRLEPLASALGFGGFRFLVLILAAAIPAGLGQVLGSLDLATIRDVFLVVALGACPHLVVSLYTTASRPVRMLLALLALSLASAIFFAGAALLRFWVSTALLECAILTVVWHVSRHPAKSGQLPPASD